MLCYITITHVLYNIRYVMLYNITYRDVIERNILYMLCYITYDMICYITCVMLCYITFVMLCYIK